MARELHECLEEGDRILKGKANLSFDDYGAYVHMNDRFHALIVEGCGNAALMRAIEVNNHLPFAPASAMLPMQSSIDEGGLHVAHRQHHNLVYAMEHAQGARAQALAEEHVEIAKMNLRHALKSPERCAQLIPTLKLISGA
jgi:GntR family transcriptional regulator of vanillate catabolism